MGQAILNLSLDQTKPKFVPSKTDHILTRFVLLIDLPIYFFWGGAVGAVDGDKELRKKTPS